MKRFVFATLTAFVLFLFSCDEIPPNIDFSVPYKTQDTTYIVSSAPVPQHKAVLIEDITGVRCVNCPEAAAEAVKIVANKTEDSVVVMALYTSQMNTLTLPWPGYPKLTNDISTEIVDILGVPGDLPKGYVDRKIFAPLTERFVQYKSWGLYVDQRLKLSTPVNIGMSSAVTGRNINVNLKFQYTADVTGNHKYALYIVEDDVVSKQTGGKPTPETYVHKHILRYAFGNSVGNPLNASLVVGRTFEKILSYDLPADYNIDNCRLICVISDVSSNEVINVREIHVK